MTAALIRAGAAVLACVYVLYSLCYTGDCEYYGELASLLCSSGDILLLLRDQRERERERERGGEGQRQREIEAEKDKDTERQSDENTGRDRDGDKK